MIVVRLSTMMHVPKYLLEDICVGFPHGTRQCEEFITCPWGFEELVTETPDSLCMFFKVFMRRLINIPSSCEAIPFTDTCYFFYDMMVTGLVYFFFYLDGVDCDTFERFETFHFFFFFLKKMILFVHVFNKTHICYA